MFCVSGFLCSMYICYEDSMYVSRSRIIAMVHISFSVYSYLFPFIYYFFLSPLISINFNLFKFDTNVCVCVCVKLFLFLFLCLLAHISFIRTSMYLFNHKFSCVLKQKIKRQLFTASRVFHSSISWWFFTGAWGAANLIIKFPGFFIILLIWEFFALALADRFPLESEWQQVSSISWILLRIRADLHEAAVYIVSTRPLIFKSSSPSTNPLVTVMSAPITNGITVTFKFLSFFSSLVSSRYSSLFSLSFNLTMRSTGTAKSTIRQVFSGFFWGGAIIWSGRLAEISLSFCISKSQRILCTSFSGMDSMLCIYVVPSISFQTFLYRHLKLS